MRLTEYIQRLQRILGEEGDLAVVAPSGEGDDEYYSAMDPSVKEVCKSRHGEIFLCEGDPESFRVVVVGE